MKLAVRLGERGKSRSLPVDFLVVETTLPYNIIMGRPTINTIKVAYHYTNYSCSMKQMMAKSGRSIGISRDSGVLHKQFKTNASEEERPRKRKGEDPLDTPTSLGVYLSENPKLYEQPQPVEEDEEIMIDEDLRRGLRIGTSLNPEIREKLISTLREYKDVFAYSASNLQGLDPSFAGHEFNIKEVFLLSRNSSIMNPRGMQQ